MKKTILGILTVLTMTSQAIAHPKDSDLLDSVGVGSKLIVSEDINVLPGRDYIWFSRFMKSKPGNLMSCFLKLEESSRDRVIPKGKELEVSKIDTVYNQGTESYGTKVILDLEGSSVIKQLECSRDKMDKHDNIFSSIPTIGETKWLLKEQIEIKLATPEVINTNL